MTKPIETCKDCKFALIEAKHPSEAFCRRYPPTVIASPQGPFITFPVMEKDHGWCGEFQRKVIFNA